MFGVYLKLAIAFNLGGPGEPRHQAFYTCEIRIFHRQSRSRIRLARRRPVPSNLRETTKPSSARFQPRLRPRGIVFLKPSDAVVRRFDDHLAEFPAAFNQTGAEDLPRVTGSTLSPLTPPHRLEWPPPDFCSPALPGFPACTRYHRKPTVGHDDTRKPRTQYALTFIGPRAAETILFARIFIVVRFGHRLLTQRDLNQPRIRGPQTGGLTTTRGGGPVQPGQEVLAANLPRLGGSANFLPGGHDHPTHPPQPTAAVPESRPPPDISTVTASI